MTWMPPVCCLFYDFYTYTVFQQKKKILKLCGALVTKTGSYLVVITTAGIDELLTTANSK